MDQEIQKILNEKVNPVLSEHFGGAELVSFEDHVVTVRLTGACSTCPSARFTVEEVVKEIVTANCPEVTDVVLDLSVSDELLDMAKKIMNKEIN